MAALTPCGGCKGLVGAIHKCPECNMSMHPFCGKGIGDEGFGQSIICPPCQSQANAPPGETLQTAAVAAAAAVAVMAAAAEPTAAVPFPTSPVAQGAHKSL